MRCDNLVLCVPGGIISSLSRADVTCTDSVNYYTVPSVPCNNTTRFGRQQCLPVSCVQIIALEVPCARFPLPEYNRTAVADSDSTRCCCMCQ